MYYSHNVSLPPHNVSLPQVTELQHNTSLTLLIRLNAQDRLSVPEHIAYIGHLYVLVSLVRYTDLKHNGLLPLGDILLGHLRHQLSQPGEYKKS